jgi:DNA invertase Pin-like site-specific DNA recombinase
MRYVIYARKSTEEEDRQVLSIESQLEELRLYSAKEKFDIVASFQEAKTAKEPGRMKFAEMLSFLEQGKAEGIIAWHPDRLARNSVDGGKIIHMVDRGLIRSLKFPTFWFEPTPQGLFMLNIAFGQSKYFSDNLRENVKRGQRQKLRNGVWPGWAPVGYKNNPYTRGIDLDKEKAQKVRKIFEMYATGAYTLNSLAEWCKAHDLRSRCDKLMTINGIQLMLQNPFYIGLMRFKSEMFEGTHEPILTKKLFDKVQHVMRSRGKVHEKRKHQFHLLGLLKCASCGGAITAEKHTKKSGRIYVYYRCTRKKGPCAEKHFVRAEDLQQQIRNFLQKVSLSSQDTEKVLAALDGDEKQAKAEARTEAENLKVEIQNLDNRLEKLLNLYLADALSTAEYAAKKEKLISEKATTSEKITDIEKKGVSWLEPARAFVLSLNQAAKLLERDDFSETTAFLKTIGSNHCVRNRRFEFTAEWRVARAAERSAAASAGLQFPVWCG